MPAGLELPRSRLLRAEGLLGPGWVGRVKERDQYGDRLAGRALHSNEAESAAMCWMAGLPRGRMTQVGFLGPKCQESRLWFNDSRRKNSHPFQESTTRAAGH